MPGLKPIRLKLDDRGGLLDLRRQLIDAYYGDTEAPEGLAKVVARAQRFATFAGLKVSKTLDVLDLVHGEPLTDRRNRLRGVKIGDREFRAPVTRLGSRQVVPGKIVVRLSTGEAIVHRRYQPAT